MKHSPDPSSNSILSAVITGFVALIPLEVFNYAEKLLSVFCLAVVAELGRRLVVKFLGREKP